LNPDIRPADLGLNAYLNKSPHQHGYIYIAFNSENFIQPVSYTKSVTNFLARSKPLKVPEELEEEPVLKSKVRFGGAAAWPLAARTLICRRPQLRQGSPRRPA
jgi:hypothetical protein